MQTYLTRLTDAKYVIGSSRLTRTRKRNLTFNPYLKTAYSFGGPRAGRGKEPEKDNGGEIWRIFPIPSNLGGPLEIKSEFLPLGHFRCFPLNRSMSKPQDSS